MLISSTIPNLINGVSQQPPTLRLASQANAQTNFLSSVSEGLVDRPPSRTLAKLDDAVWDTAFSHKINRDTTERYVLAIREGSIRVFDIKTGAEKTLNAPDGLSYLTTTGDDAEVFRAVTVADYTFVLNRERKFTLSSDQTPARANKALVAVKAGNYGRTYSIHINDTVVASFTTPDGSQSSHTAEAATDYIATQLKADSAGKLPAGFTLTQFGDLLVVESASSADFSVRVEDGAGGINLAAFYKTVQRFSDLPAEAPSGFEIEVAGDNSSSFDNYYVKFTTDAASSSVGTGVWKETLAPEETFRWDKTTMPHVLVRESDGTFTFRQGDWNDREVGDAAKMSVSAEGQAVSDIFFFRNRLGVSVDEGTLLSRDGEYFNFWRASATTLLDTDPIDVGVATEQVSIINYAVPFNRTLLLFSDQAQFVLEGGDILSPKTVSVAQATSFESLRGVRPTGLGPHVYFPTPRGGYAGVREYFVQENNTQNDARDISSHVPRYIPKGLFKMAASSSEETIVLLSKETRNKMWVYRYYANDDGKLQSAWCEWEMDADDIITNATFIESSIYLLISRSTGTYLEVLNLEEGDHDQGSSIRFNVDRGVYVSGLSPVYDAVGGVTTFTLPYDTSADKLRVVVMGEDGKHPEGTLLPIKGFSNGNTVQLAGDHTSSKLLAGIAYERSYEFSTFYTRSAEPGGGISANAAGRLQIRYLYIDYDRTSYFKVVVKAHGRDPFEKVFTGRILGTRGGEVGRLPLETGRFSVPVLGRNTDVTITIKTDSHLPTRFISAEWEAQYTSRARKAR